MTGRTQDFKTSTRSKFNRKFGARCRRYERWYKILRKLSEFEGLVNNYDSASPDEVRALREIHSYLYQCQITAKRYEEELRPYVQRSC